MLKLYLLSRTSDLRYNSYDSCVVAAESEELAKLIHPDGSIYPNNHSTWGHEWEKHPKYVMCELIGKANSNLKENSVVIASFNAG